jgi:importin subunit alpha-1
VAGDSAELRNYVFMLNIMDPLLEIFSNMHSEKLTMVRNATWTLSNLCRGKNPPPDWSFIAPALPTLYQLIYHEDKEVVGDACWAISYLTDGPNERIQGVLNAGVGRRLVELLLHPHPGVQTPALRSVGNIVTGTDSQTQAMINNSVLPALAQLLQTPKDSIRKEVCWTISNITAGTVPQVQAVIDSNLIPPLIAAMGAVNDFRVRKEATWAISNATSGGTAEQIQFIVDRGCIKPLCDMLVTGQGGHNDTKVVQITLDALSNILRAGTKLYGDGDNKFATFIDAAGGVAQMEYLQGEHADESVYNKCYEIIAMYFQGSDDAENMQPPAVDTSSGTYTFGGGEGSQASSFHF